ncbi:MAG: hypothetical protein U5O39_11285 [Gammaproteobacteria bacterium]|nr:hypothetical protein [Gammaproteobacteria bacterium]
MSLHQVVFRQVYAEIYDRFYEELGNVISSMAPELDRRTAVDRARLVTALLDGAAMQVQRGSKAGFLRDVAEVATAIAVR